MAVAAAGNSKMTSTNSSATDKPKSIWDNDLPAGDSPPMPSWPLKFWIAVYVAWMIFLISMVVVRFQTV